MLSVWRDLRYGLRMLGKNPGFTSIAILTIAIGIGANAAIFSFLETVLLRNLPVRDAEQLVVIAARDSDGPASLSFSYPMYLDLQAKNKVMTGVIARAGASMNLVHAGGGERIRGELVSGNYFAVLGVQPWIGRLISEADDTATGGLPVAVISFDFWKRRFGSDPSIINQSFILNNHRITVIGVTPPGFYGTDISESPEIQVPLSMTKMFRPFPANRMQNRRQQWLTLMARRKADVSIEQSQASMDVLFRQIRQEEAHEFSAGTSAYEREQFLATRLNVMKGEQGFLHLQREFRRPMWLLMAVTTMVLLILTANLANMLLARTVARQSETTVRLALGATRGRLVQQWLTESVLISVLGGIAGLLFAGWAKNALVGFLPTDLQRNLDTPLNWRVFAVALGASILVGILMGLAPGVRASLTSLAHSLRSGASAIVSGGDLFNLRSTLIVLQVALCLPLLVGAGLFLRSLRNLKSIDAGYGTTNILLASLDPSSNGYDADRIKNLYTEILGKVRATSGVRSACLASYSPVSGSWDQERVAVQGYQPREGENMSLYSAIISPDYFRTLDIPLLAGREFTDGDQATSQKVAIINESMARYFFGSQDPLGKRIGTDDGPGAKPEIEIVGVVKDAKYVELREDAQRHFYIPVAQVPRLFDLTLHVNTIGDPAKTAELIREDVKSVAPNLPLYDVKTLAMQIDESLTKDRLIGWLTSMFGLLATFLAAIGLYGVVGFTVLRRTREIGIRVSLGARDKDVVWLILKQTLGVVGVGTIIGLGLSLAMGKVLQSMLFELNSIDPLAFAVAALVLVGAAAIAAYIPARRAMHIDPFEALRYE